MRQPTRSFVRWWPFAALVIVVGIALVAASRGTGDSNPAAQRAARVSRLTSEIRCPTCKGLSVAQSDAEAARAINAEVVTQVNEGRSDAEILSYVEQRYGTDILLRPAASGFDALVWAVPVAALVIAIAGLAFAFRHWRGTVEAHATDDDRALVARAMASSAADGLPPAADGSAAALTRTPSDGPHG